MQLDQNTLKKEEHKLGVITNLNGLVQMRNSTKFAQNQTNLSL